jgi:hypothetical protein
MNIQEIAKIKSDGKKPVLEVITGRASIPAPIEVPATRRVAPNVCKRNLSIMDKKYKFIEKENQDTIYWSHSRQWLYTNSEIHGTGRNTFKR